MKTCSSSPTVASWQRTSTTISRSALQRSSAKTTEGRGTVYGVPSCGVPAHVLQLKSGSIVCAYGYRRAPFGVRVAFSADGETWEERILRDDGEHGDLGYPASVQLADERILTVYYFHDADGVRFIAGSVYAE